MGFFVNCQKCYIGKIKLYMIQMDPSFCLDVIAKVVTVAGVLYMKQLS